MRALLHPATLTRQAAFNVIHGWTGEPGPLLAWAVGNICCEHTCLTAVWELGPVAHPALHRERFQLGGFGYSLDADRKAAWVQWWSGTAATVTWDEVSAIIGPAPGPDLSVVAAAIRVLDEDLAAGATRFGGTERDLRVLTLDAWAALRPDALLPSADALFEVSA